MTEEKKRLISKWNWIWLAVVGFIFLYIILGKFGIHMAYHSEKTEVISNAGKGKKRISSPVAVDGLGTKPDYDLEQIAESFAEDALDDLSYFGLDRKEEVFYERIYEAFEDYSDIEDARDWFRVLKRLQQAHRKLSEIYQVHDDDTDTDEVFADIENVFGVSKADCKSFAQRGGRDMLDWVIFIEQTR